MSYSSYVCHLQADSCSHENLTVAKQTKEAPIREQEGVYTPLW